MKKNRKNEEVTLASIAKSLERLPTKADLEKSVEELAIITANGFENTVSKSGFTDFRKEMAGFKEDMTDFAKKTGVTLFNIDSKLQTVDQRLDAIEKTLGPLVQASSFYQSTLREHERRLSLIEREVGLAKQS